MLGDTKYGDKEMFQALKQNPIQLHLHARSLKLKTLNGDVMTFTAPPPEHMVDTLHYHGIDWEQFC
jgi:23S rRNA-/tRNA-specific pseudouridylate synthase